MTEYEVGLLIIKMISLPIAIAYGSAIAARTVMKNDISAMQMWLWAISATAFITAQWLLP
jgi:hypothetical protein